MTQDPEQDAWDALDQARSDYLAAVASEDVAAITLARRALAVALANYLKVTNE